MTGYNTGVKDSIWGLHICSPFLYRVIPLIFLIYMGIMGITGVIEEGDDRMEYLEIMEQIEELEREIAALPEGSISKKLVKGKEYFYHRVTRNKKRTETYIDFEQVEDIGKQIEKRKTLELKLKELKMNLPKSKSEKKENNTYEFLTYVRVGNQLKKLASYAEKYRKRECYSKLYDYVFGEQQDRVFILYGLRRTGKTTLIRQVLLDMSSEEMEKAAFIQIKSKDTLSDVNADLKYLERMGYEYVFIDEVTLMEDFIEGAALFSDIYASSGMKIVLSGTDSLGFVFTQHEQLYDRCIMLHTTFIPYREFENVLGIKGIDEYIRYGGTMSMGGIDYNKTSSFATKNNANEYIDTAIAKNIQHSLQYYQDGGHFRHLYELYQKRELTNAINRVVEDMNHNFTKETITKAFRSHDLSVSTRNLMNDRENPIDLNYNIDRDSVESYLMDMLEILNKEDQSVEIDETHVYQIKEYLLLLDLIMEVDLLHLPNANQQEKITVISQPGIRYAQADALVNSLMLDEKFNILTLVERNRIIERILSEIKGRMMEEIVLLETKMANPEKEVFQLQFAVGEFDMVIFDPQKLSCEIFEIKYSTEIVPNQYRHLINTDKCRDTEHRFGTITGKYVIYRGESAEVEGISYLNVEDYLKFI